RVEPARGGVAGRGAAQPAAAQRQAAGAGGPPARADLRGPRRGPGGARGVRQKPPRNNLVASGALELGVSFVKRAVKERMGQVVTRALWCGGPREGKGAQEICALSSIARKNLATAWNKSTSVVFTT